MTEFEGSIDEHRLMVADCEARESRLSDWEREFVDSVGKQLDISISLTPRQAETLDAIWTRATAKG